MINHPSNQYGTSTQANTVGNYDTALPDYIRVAVGNAWGHSWAKTKLPESADRNLVLCSVV